ncbi:hypothetical protein HYV10_01740 [Candidatus Dependentiae bacterium]|nr:hypothetical protein [Candidatus Dependentiae bacterium]
MYHYKILLFLFSTSMIFGSEEFTQTISTSQRQSKQSLRTPIVFVDTSAAFDASSLTTEEKTDPVSLSAIASTIEEKTDPVNLRAIALAKVMEIQRRLSTSMERSTRRRSAIDSEMEKSTKRTDSLSSATLQGMQKRNFSESFSHEKIPNASAADDNSSK